MYTLEFKPSFVRDLKKYSRQGRNIQKIHNVLNLLRRGKSLPQSVKDHQLQGKLRQYRECHIEKDRLLVYEKDGKHLRIHFLWLTSHKKLKERERSL